MTHETEHERDEWRSWWAPVASQFDQANKQEVSLATWLAARSKQPSLVTPLPDKDGLPSEQHPQAQEALRLTSEVIDYLRASPDAEIDRDNCLHFAARINGALSGPKWESGVPSNLYAAVLDVAEWLNLIERLHIAGRWPFSQPDSLDKLRGCRANLLRFMAGAPVDAKGGE